MSYHLHEEELDGIRICVDYDTVEEFMNPREHCNLGTMVCFHGKYTLGDPHDYKSPASFIADLWSSLMPGKKYKTITDDLLDYMPIVWLPLYLYDHSGITMSVAPFSCRWDSGQVGVIYVTHDKIKEEYGDVNNGTIEKAKKVLRSEVEVYDHYLTGDVYSYTIYDGDEPIDSCGGFLGDPDYCLQQAKEAARGVVQS